MNDPIHGTRRSYNHGCRCVECRLANTEHRREVRAEPAGRYCLICGMAWLTIRCGPVGDGRRGDEDRHHDSSDAETELVVVCDLLAHLRAGTSPVHLCSAHRLRPLDYDMTATFYVGDAVTVMNTLPEKSVDLILTSPPFLSLRSYLPMDHPDKPLEGGSQSTPGEFIDWLLDVVEACARVLAPHGSLCFELGDTYAGSGGSGGDYQLGGWRAGQPPAAGSMKHERVHKIDGWGPFRDEWDGKKQGGGKGWPLAKSLSLIPETFRFAMVYGINPHTGRRTAPWRLRNVIRWVRPNPPVGALGDKFRPATSELMVFCKAKDRFFDLDAVREPYSEAFIKAAERGATQHFKYHRQFNPGVKQLDPGGGAPPLDWWNIPPGGYPGAHYAVWPPELLVKPIKAMCPEKVCRRCGEASRRIVEVSYTPIGGGRRPGGYAQGAEEQRSPTGHYGEGYTNSPDAMRLGAATRSFETTGFSDCGHDDYRSGVVLDPFAGSGTTLSVATGHGRDAIGIDLDERNYELALDRVGPLVLSRAA